MKKIVLSSLCLLGFLMACNKDDDNKKNDQSPVFTSLKVEDTEYVNTTEDIEIHLGEDFDFTVGVSDDNELSELQVEIHSAFDGHDHDHSRLASLASDTLKFGPEIRVLSGKSDEKTFNVFTANDTSIVHGEYHLEMIVLDKAGNRTEKIVPLHIEGQH